MTEMTEERALIEQLITFARRSHYSSEDGWYSCPLSEDGCFNPDEPDGVCNCGADKRNTEVDRIAALLHKASMTEERAREILGDAIWEMGLEWDAENFVAWARCNQRAYLGGNFTADELEAIAFWMRRNAT